ncbi:general odorant-binding protein 56h-like [Eurosta solidaginis]|uniref:general odorant-binding protein 56h-like n=1 Tax=Eurosta solidaginis TaxID=178769 RepID=UPI003531163D
MKSFIIIVLVFAFAVVGMHSMPDAEMRKYIDDCVKENHVPPQEFQDLLEGKVPAPSENLKCSTLCVMVKGGLMDESGTFKADAVKGKMADNEKFTNAVDECKSQKGSSPCDTAMKLTQCMISHKSM